MEFRIGQGIDIHQLKESEKLILGGVEIESPFGTVGHSDADVLIHAICDALLGAANLRDIGYHFPDTDPELKGADSKEILGEVVGMITKHGFVLNNVDASVMLQSPKIQEYIPEMQNVLSKILKVRIDQVSIKATTAEKLGFVGEGKGIQAQAVVLLSRS